MSDAPVAALAEKHFDVAIVGAGITGCAAAAAFARHDRQVLLLDCHAASPLSRASHILHPGALAALAQLGLQPVLDGIAAAPIRGYTVHAGEETAGVFFGLPRAREGWAEKRAAEAQARGVRREALQRGLRERVAGDARVTRVQGTVTQVLVGGVSGEVVGVECFRTGEQRAVHFFANLTILCDGPFSDLRPALLRSPRPPPSDKPTYPRHWCFDIPNCPLPIEEMACSIPSAASCAITLFRIAPTTVHARIALSPALSASIATATAALRTHLATHVVPLIPASSRAAFAAAVHNARFEPLALGMAPRHHGGLGAAGCQPGVFLLHEEENTEDAACDAGVMVALKDVVLLADLLSKKECWVRRRSLAAGWRVRVALAKFRLQRKRHTAPIDMVGRLLRQWDSPDETTHAVLQRSIVAFLAKGECTYRIPVQSIGGLLEKRSRLLRPLVKLTLCAIHENFCALTGVADVCAVWWRVVVILWLAGGLAVRSFFCDVL